MLTDEQILKIILETTAEMGITAYDISKNTSISDQAVHKILTGKTSKPRRKNLLEILKYLEERRAGSATPGDKNYLPEFAAKWRQVQETPIKYDTRDSGTKLLEQLEATIKLHQYINYLERTLNDKNIPFKKEDFYTF